MAFVHSQLVELVKVAELSVKLNDMKRALKHDLQKAQTPSKFGKMFESFANKIRPLPITSATIISDSLTSTGLSDVMNNTQIEKKTKEIKDAVAYYMNQYDLQKAKITWLIRDFDLSSALIQVQDQINTSHIELMSEKVAGEENTIQSLEDMSDLLEKKREVLWEDLLTNDKESVVLGLHMLDKNCTGKVEAEDMSQLTSCMFNELDRDKDHAISEKDLQTAIDSNEEKLATIDRAIVEQEKEISTAQADLNKLREEMDQIGEDKAEEKTAAQTRLEAKDVEIQRLNVDLQQLVESKRKADELITIVEETFFKTFKNKVWSQMTTPGLKSAQQQMKEVHDQCAAEQNKELYKDPEEAHV